MLEPRSVVLADYTTLQVGGCAQLVEVNSVAELQAAREIAKQFPAPPLLLAGGSNLLLADAGYEGLVIKNNITSRHYEVTADAVRLTVGAGEVFDDVVADASARGYWGLENLSAIPGSVGATPVQNVGAYGVEVADIIEVVHAVHLETGVGKTFTPEACRFAYRDSFFKTDAGKQWCITSVTVRLSAAPRALLHYADLQSLQNTPDLTPQTVREKVIAIRAKKFPDWRRVGTAGSFFKNPIISRAHFEKLLRTYPALPGHVTDDSNIKVSLGWILDKLCGLRGHCTGPVCLYEQQALVLVNTGGATAADVTRFAKQVGEIVKDKTDIAVEWEVRQV